MNRRGFFRLLGQLATVGAVASVYPGLLKSPPMWGRSILPGAVATLADYARRMDPERARAIVDYLMEPNPFVEELRCLTSAPNAEPESSPGCMN